MMMLTIRTDKPEAELGLLKDDAKIAFKMWAAHRELAETLNTQIKDLLESQQQNLKSLGGIVVYQGPGSFTGLRIGISVANTLGFALQIPVVGGTGDNWIAEGQKELKTAQFPKYVLPEYGSEVFTTKPKK